MLRQLAQSAAYPDQVLVKVVQPAPLQLKQRGVFVARDDIDDDFRSRQVLDVGQIRPAVFQQRIGLPGGIISQLQKPP